VSHQPATIDPQVVTADQAQPADLFTISCSCRRGGSVDLLRARLRAEQVTCGSVTCLAEGEARDRHPVAGPRDDVVPSRVDDREPSSGWAELEGNEARPRYRVEARNKSLIPYVPGTCE
jgi:hypothetical protein